jgi:hypothetical protein
MTKQPASKTLVSGQFNAAASLTPEKEPPPPQGGIYWIGGWVGPGDGLDKAVAKEPTSGRPEYKTCHFNDWNIPVQVKLSLCLTKHHAMRTYDGVEV